MSDTYLYFDGYLEEAGTLVDERLATLEDRHRIDLDVPGLRVLDDPTAEIARHPDAGVIFRMPRGWPGRTHLQIGRDLLQQGRRVLLHFPQEKAVEVLDEDRFRSYTALWGATAAFRVVGKARRSKGALRHRVAGTVPGRALRKGLSLVQGPADSSPPPDVPVVETVTFPVARRAAEVRRAASPVDVRGILNDRGGVDGTGVYLRTDFWQTQLVGGSYGHTCYVARELQRAADDLVFVSANRYELIDDWGIRQVKLDVARRDGVEENLLAADDELHAQLRPVCEALGASFIYERLCLGNLAGARVSQALGIPYIVEYNGSELSMRRSFGDGNGFAHEEAFEAVEDAAFAQASIINVVSQVVAEQLVDRGVDPEKILINPNGADPVDYAPAPADERAALRAELGYGDEDCVVGFIGTFGGWHGIDVLSKALPDIAAKAPHTRFLLVGDGAHRPAVDAVVAEHGLGDRVSLPGRVTPAEGARLLRACDVFVSPHSSDMVDSRFFGSPTKLFEYMALGGAIVASDLEQIGEVMSPALRPEDLDGDLPELTDQRSVLCKPGDVDGFVRAVAGLASRPDLVAHLGANARQALLDSYSWERHVARIWRFAADPVAYQTGHVADTADVAETPDAARRYDDPASGNADKDEVIRQWNADPCGSHYVKGRPGESLEWFLQVERHRYTEYGPWMPEVMEFDRWAGKEVLEIGAGMGTDLAQFAKHGANVTDCDLAPGHLDLAKRNFELRGLDGTFVLGDGEDLPFEDGTFDLVYTNGVIHHTPNTGQVVEEIRRVLKPGGKVIAMVYAERSLHYWRNLVVDIGVKEQALDEESIGEIMSRSVEISEEGARPLVKVYSRKRLLDLFRDFEGATVLQRQMTEPERPRWIPDRVPLDVLEKVMGWNLIIKAHKPR